MLLWWSCFNLPNKWQITIINNNNNKTPLTTINDDDNSGCLLCLHSSPSHQFDDSSFTCSFFVDSGIPWDERGVQAGKNLYLLASKRMSFVSFISKWVMRETLYFKINKDGNFFQGNPSFKCQKTIWNLYWTLLEIRALLNKAAWWRFWMCPK